MFLIPQPKTVKTMEGYFDLNRDTEIILDSSCDAGDFKAAKLLKEEIEKSAGIKVKINKAFSVEKSVNFIYLKKFIGNREPEGYNLEIAENGITLCGNDSAGLFYAVQTLRQIIRQQETNISCIIIEDAPHFKNRGFFHDVTRGKVPTLKTLKELVDRLAFYKINQLQLYIEHTFAFKNFSEVWSGKSPLSAEEILELDAYCLEKNIELVPSLPTFGHLYEVLRTKSYNHLCELPGSHEMPYTWYDRMAHHTLDVSNDESFELVKYMLGEFLPLFSSNKFNIGCDETFDLGKGKSEPLAKKIGTDRLYVDFLIKIINYVKKFDKEVMFWGDIIVKCPEYLKEIPEDVVCLNWDYSSDVKEEGTRVIAQSGIKQYVCPGVGGWNRVMNAIDNAYLNISKMIGYGKKHGAIGVLNTDWGDYGHINLLGNSMPGMIFGAALSWNPDDSRDFEKLSEGISVVEYGDNSGRIVQLLTELSQKEVASWTFLVWWKEQKLLDNEFLNENIKQLYDADIDNILEGYNKALQYEKEITGLVSQTITDRRLDMREFANSARGVALMNAACLLIRQSEHKSAEADEKMKKTLGTVLKGDRIAVELEYWFEAFSELWRERNKESELRRIGDMIAFLCECLRDEVKVKV